MIKHLAWVGLALVAVSCDRSTNAEGSRDWSCVIPADSTPEFVTSIGCLEDYKALATRPYDSSIPGAFMVKIIVDLADSNRLYLLNTQKNNLHYFFILNNLSGNGKPLVPSQSEFNVTEYYTPDRRFVLGILAYNEKSGIWTWQLTPSDNAGAALIALAHRKIVDACFCGKDLAFHANSLSIEAEARKLPASIKVTSTTTVYDGVDYQPLSSASCIGQLVFTTAERLNREYAGPRDIVVSDSVPDDFPFTVGGLITQQFQSLVYPINVIAQDRGIPNMGLRGALANPDLRALEGKWVRFNVGTFDYSVSEATEAEASAWWDSLKPPSAVVPSVDTSVVGLQDVETILDTSLGLTEALKRAISAYGGMTGHYSAFPHMDRTKLTYEPAFGIPVRYYLQHMQANGLNDTVDSMLADPEFQTNPVEKDRRLASLREAILNAPLDPGFWKLLNEKLDAKFPALENFRFTPSTNAGDLAGLTGSGTFGFRTGGRTDASHSIKHALLEVWAGMWDLRAFEERSYFRIDHKAMGVGALVQGDRGGIQASGLAITVNPFDVPEIWPGFYINTQVGETPVTHSNPSIIPEQLIYQFRYPGQPIVLLARSNQVPNGTTVLTLAQTYALGTALLQIQDFFTPAYGEAGPPKHGMYTEFVLGQAPGTTSGGDPVITMELVRPFRGSR